MFAILRALRVGTDIWYHFSDSKCKHFQNVNVNLLFASRQSHLYNFYISSFVASTRKKIQEKNAHILIFPCIKMCVNAECRNDISTRFANSETVDGIARLL